MGTGYKLLGFNLASLLCPNLEVLSNLQYPLKPNEEHMQV